MAPPFVSRGPRATPHPGSIRVQMGLKWAKGCMSEKDFDDLDKVLMFAQVAERHLQKLVPMMRDDVRSEFRKAVSELEPLLQ